LRTSIILLKDRAISSPSKRQSHSKDALIVHQTWLDLVDKMPLKFEKQPFIFQKGPLVSFDQFF